MQGAHQGPLLYPLLAAAQHARSSLLTPLFGTLERQGRWSRSLHLQQQAPCCGGMQFHLCPASASVGHVGHCASAHPHTLALHVVAVHLPQRLLDRLSEQLFRLELCHCHDSVSHSFHVHRAEAMDCHSTSTHPVCGRPCMGANVHQTRCTLRSCIARRHVHPLWRCRDFKRIC